MGLDKKAKNKRGKVEEKATSEDAARDWNHKQGKTLYERERETLPIKKDGKIVRQIITEVVAPSEDEQSDASEGDHDVDDDDANNERNEDEVESDNEYDFKPDFTEESGDFEKVNDDSDNDSNDEMEDAPPVKKAKKEHKKNKDKKKKMLVDSDDSDAEDEKDAEKAKEEEKVAQKKSKKDTSTKHKYLKALSRRPISEIQQYIGNICRGVLDSPELALKRRAPGKEPPLLSTSTNDDVEADYKLLDLFDILSAIEENVPLFNDKALELAMLSMLLIFKDIVPSYRIRPQTEKSNNGQNPVQLKKQTKSLRDFELALLGAYQRYLKILEDFTLLKLGKTLTSKYAAKKGIEISNSNSNSKSKKMSSLGLSALRCQCELLINLSHFNFRQKLITSIVKRAASSNKEYGNIARDSISTLFTKDKQGEATLECVKLMAITATATKFKGIPEDFIRTLFTLKLEVRTEEARSLKMKAKKERRKRKRATDDIAMQMTENSAVMEKVTIQKLQANTLHEISLIYFRIIKGKIGYELLPVALDGVSRISHLLNLETMEELVELMRSLIDRKDGSAPLPSPEIQIQCIYCALKVLNGPGETLNIDIIFFANKLAIIIYTLPINYIYYNVVLECINICYISNKNKNSNDRITPIQAFIKILLQFSGHQQASTGTVTILAMAHSMLLAHPRLRNRYVNLSSSANTSARPLFEEDDEVGDLAMIALKAGVDKKDKANGNILDSTNTTNENGSWMVSLLKRHADPMVRHVVSSLTSKDINPLPVRTYDAKFDPIIIMNRTDNALEGVNKNIEQSQRRRSKVHNKKNSEARNIYRKQEMYKEDTDRQWKSIKHLHVAQKPDVNSKALQSIFRTMNNNNNRK
jgi:hypothetical protein